MNECLHNEGLTEIGQCRKCGFDCRGFWAEMQQKGEKMPTFEKPNPPRTIRGALELMVQELHWYAKKYGLGPVKLQYALNEGDRALAACPPAASEERLKWDAGKFELEWHEKWCRETAGTKPLRYDVTRAFHNAIYEAGYQAALQSVPSSLPRPEGCICSEAYGVGSEQCGRHGAPSDAGQPSLEKLRELPEIWLERLSKCVGYPTCDGDLPGEEHSERCPERGRNYVPISVKICARELQAILAELEPK